MAYVKLTNTTDKERRAIYTSEGYVTIEPGQSKVVDVSDADLKANKDYFKHEKADQSEADEEEAVLETDRINPPEPLPEADAYDGMSDEALRDMIEEKTGDRPHPRTGRAKLLDAVRAAE